MSPSPTLGDCSDPNEISTNLSPTRPSERIVAKESFLSTLRVPPARSIKTRTFSFGRIGNWICRTVPSSCCLATSFRRRLRQRFSASSSDLFHAFRECERGEAQKAWDARPRDLSCYRHCLSRWPTWRWHG